MISRGEALTIVVVLGLSFVLQGMPLSIGPYHNQSRLTTPQLAASASSPDFNLTVSPRTIYLYRGTSANSAIEVRNLGGFSGSVLLDVLTDAYTTDGISFSVNPNPLEVPVNGSANSTLTVSATTSARFANYDVTVKAYVGGLTHNETIRVQFAWFTISAPTFFNDVGLGSSENIPVTITSYSGFTGTVYLTANSYSSGIGVSVNPSVLRLVPDGTNETVVKISIPQWFCPCDEGGYTVDLYANGRGVSNVFSIFVTTPTVWISLTTAIALVLAAIILIALPTLVYVSRKKSHHSIATQRKESAWSMNFGSCD